MSYLLPRTKGAKSKQDKDENGIADEDSLNQDRGTVIS